MLTSFRWNAVKQQKKAQKNVQHSEAVGKEQVANALKRALALVNAEKGQFHMLFDVFGSRCTGTHARHQQSRTRLRARNSSSWSRSPSENSSPPVVSSTLL